MKDFSVPMALVDFIPVVFFGLASVILMGDLYRKMSKASYALFSSGTIMVFFAGFFKALYKLLYALGVCDFEILSKMMMPLQSIGFILGGIGLLLVICKGRKSRRNTVAPPYFAGTLLFIPLMVVGLGIMDAALCILSVKLKKPWLIAVFVFSFICSLCMGYLSSQDFAKASMNWIAEFVNIAGQGTLLIGAWMLHKSGLDKLIISKGE